MPDALAQLDDYGLYVAAVTAGLTAIAWIVRRIYQGARTIEAVYRLVDHELKPNSGSSLRDAVDRAAASSRAAQETAERAHGEAAATRAALDEHLRAADQQREAGHREALKMWAAIEAIAKAQPPQEDT